MGRGGHVAQRAAGCPALFALAFAGCLSSTHLTVNAPGARVFVDDQLIGEAPVTLAAPAVAGGKLWLRVEAPGFREYVGALSADRWSAGRVVVASLAGVLTGGLGLLGLAFATEWAPAYHVILQPLGASPSKPAAGPAVAAPPPPDYRPPASTEARP